VDDGDGGGVAIVWESRGDPPCGEAAATAAGAHGDGNDRRRAAGGHWFRCNVKLKVSRRRE